MQSWGTHQLLNATLNSSEAYLELSNHFIDGAILAFDKILQIVAFLGQLGLHFLNAPLKGLEIFVELSSEAAVQIVGRVKVLLD